MEIVRADNSGFCFGVKRALEIAEKEIAQFDKSNMDAHIYTCGPLIHNNQVTSSLEERGCRIINSLDEASSMDTVIIRSHGEPKEFYDKAKELKIKLTDTTCPFVSRIHELVKNAYNEGRKIIIIGDKEHQEVIATNGWCNYEGIIIGTTDDAKDFVQESAQNHLKGDSFLVVCQTTIRKELMEDIIDVLQKNDIEFDLHNTICNATTLRQDSCSKLAKESDAMIIIGGRHSSNTQKLFEISKRNCDDSYFVENIEDLPLKEMKKYNKIGIAAGASTPESAIKEVIAKMSEVITNENMTTEEVKTEEITTEEAKAEVVETEEVKEEVATEEAKVDEPKPEPKSEETMTMADFMDEIEASTRLPRNGEIVTGTVHQVTDKEVIVNLGCKKDGILPADEVTLDEGETLTSVFKPDDEIQAKVIKTDDGDGSILLSKKRLEISEHWTEINEAHENKDIINVKVIRAVNGGVIAAYKEVTGFIPMSQLSDRFVEADKAEEYIGKTMDVRVTRVDPRRNRAVFSHKAVIMDEKQKQIANIWENLSVGDVVEGTVMRFTDYGAFVDIGGLDGLLHISEISWGKLRHPEEVLSIGETVNVKILSMNQEKNKISLGLKQITPEPWSVINEKYQIGSIVPGKVVQIKEYGAFVELEPGMDGLVHISEVANKRVADISDELKVGQEVLTKILDIDTERKRISLSIKATMDDAEGETQDESSEPKEETAPAEEVAEEAAPVETVEEAVEEVADEAAPAEAAEEAEEVPAE